MMTYAGVDLGATHLRAVVADEGGDIVGRYRAETPQGPTGDAITEAVLTAIRQACESAGIEPSALESVGIASIGPLDLDSGMVVEPANVPDEIESIPLLDPVSHLAATDDVLLHNDAQAGVIGARFFGDAVPDNVVYLTISSGIGAGVCVDGNVLSGMNNNAGEVGHFTLEPDGLPCGCGGSGHWESYASGTAIPQYARWLSEAEEIDTALDLNRESFDAATIFAHAGFDPLADAVIDRIGDWNARGIATIVHAYAPELVIVGGAVAHNNPELILQPIRDRLEELVVTDVPEIRLTSLGDDVVVLGALASAMDAA